MKSILGRKWVILASLVLPAMAMPAAWAGGIDEFKLTRAIPADAFFAVHSRDHAGKEFLNKQYARVWEAVEKARFGIDIKRLLKVAQQTGSEPEAEAAQFEQWWQQVTDLCTSVEWSSLAKREFALGMKLGFPTIEFVMLMMPPENKLADSFEGLSGVLKTVVELDPNSPLKLTTEEDGDTVIHKVALVGAPFPLGVTVARHKDVILVGFGPTMAEQSLALLRGEGGAALAATERFKGAFKKLPPPTDALTYTDIARLIEQLRATVGAGIALTAAGAPAEGEPGYEDFVKFQALPGKIIDAIDMFEYEAEVTTTDGMLSTTDSIMVLRNDAETRALYPVLFGNQPLRDPLKYVPETAGEFWVTSGIDLPALYRAVLQIIREDVPNGEQVVAWIESLKGQPSVDGVPTTQPGIDIETDIVGWIGGSLITFSVPGPTPYSNSEFVIMLSVRDQAKAGQMLGRLFAVLEPLLRQQNGSIVDSEIEGAEGFKSIVLPMLAMVGMTKPTLGVKDGWLFVGSSPGIIVTATDVAAGKAENFSKNERFLKEGIPPQGSVSSLSFTDKTKMGEQLGQALQMAPMIGMMAPPDVVKNPLVQSVLGIVGKLGRVVRKLDFYQSSASRSTFDGRAVVCKSITTYREPPVITKPKPPTTETEGEVGAGGTQGESAGTGK